MMTSRHASRSPPLVRAVQPRTLDAFDDLARRSEWRIDASIDRQFSYNPRLTKR
jgi:hypothetical protein